MRKEQPDVLDDDHLNRTLHTESVRVISRQSEAWKKSGDEGWYIIDAGVKIVRS